MNAWVRVAALLGAAGVALGAVGAHALRPRLAPPLYAIWETAVHYQLFHAAALLALGLYAAASGRSVRIPAALLTAGVVLFAGGLYLLSGAGFGQGGLAAPLGGACLIAGWLSVLTLRR